MKISSQSLQFVPAKVAATQNGLQIDLSGDTVQMAFPVAEVAPVGGDWKSATWETDATTSPTKYLARCLVGPAGTVSLSAGTYDVWVKVTHSPEIPVIQVQENGRPMKLVVY